ncbi:MAG: hypothetical protein F4X36_16070 [Gammaproteobacteria bacterium]|nr:hypothetical protein [Gammaproteobacteria bacterium]
MRARTGRDTAAGAAPPTTAGAPVTGYGFQWRYSGDPDWNDVARSPSQTSYSLTAADGSKAVEARVRAANRAGNSAWSSTATLAAASLRRFTGARHSASDFAIAIDGRATPYGIWSDGTTAWVSDSQNDRLWANTLATGARDTNKEIGLPPIDGYHVSNTGIWSDGTTIWVADNRVDRVRAYTLATGARDTTKEFSIAVSGGIRPSALWSDGTTLWVTDGSANATAARAFTLATGARDSSKDLTQPTGPSGSCAGIWSDGSTYWATLTGGDSEGVYAFSMSTGARDSSQDIDLGAGNTTPRGIWSDGETMWVVDSNKTVYAYR